MSVGAVQMFNPCLSSLRGSGRIIDVKWMKTEFLMDGGSYVYPISSSSSEYVQGMFTALFLLLPERTRPDRKDTVGRCLPFVLVRHHQGLQAWSVYEYILAINCSIMAFYSLLVCLKAILDYFSMKLSVEIKKWPKWNNYVFDI